MDIRTWLTNLGMERYADAFEDIAAKGGNWRGLAPCIVM